MHDELGQVLVTIKMECASLAKTVSGLNEQAHKRLLHAVSLVDRGMSCVRRLCAELRPGVLDNLGLPAAIEWQAEAFAFQTGIRCSLGPLQAISLSAERSAEMFRIFQDILRNMAEHAAARRVEVSMWQKSGFVALSVRDDGTSVWTSGKSSLGFLGIRERTEVLKGHLLVDSGRGRGTRVTVVIPQKGQLMKVVQSYEDPVSRRSRRRTARS